MFHRELLIPNKREKSRSIHDFLNSGYRRRERAVCVGLKYRNTVSRFNIDLV